MIKKIIIGQLFPKQLNIYGDQGNVLSLQKRLEWRGLASEVIEIGSLTSSISSIDLIIGGGGQDSGQIEVSKTLLRMGPEFRAAAEDGLPMLMICGSFQLFGNWFVTSQREKLEGLGIFNCTTTGGESRSTGNITVETKFGVVTGFENHSGQTELHEGQQSFGHTKKSYGNNLVDTTEGAITENVIGSYLHGPLLPRNPSIADFLLQTALKRKYPSTDLSPIDDSIEGELHRQSVKLRR